MFTLQQITSAHALVKSGADFPAYIHNLKQLGVLQYETFVKDGHTTYFGADGYTIHSPSKYAVLKIAEKTNAAKFAIDLKAHQHGQSDYPTFCRQSAEAGVEKWVVNLDALTCTYFDLSGATILTEAIPQ